MTSHNEFRKMIAAAFDYAGFLDSESSVAQSDSGIVYVRLRDQVFAIGIDEVEAISKHPNARAEAEKFMATQPHQYEKVQRQ